MTIQEGARRIGQVAHLMVFGSLFLVIFWWNVSLALFVGGWALYGAAYILDGFAASTPEQSNANHA